MEYHVFAPTGEIPYLNQHREIHPTSVHYFKNHEELTALLHDHNERADAYILLSSKKSDVAFMRTFKRPTFYIQHGIRGNYMRQSVISWFKGKRVDIGQQFFSAGVYEKKALQAANVKPSTYRFLPGLPQTDYAMLISKKLKDPEYRSHMIRSVGLDPDKRYFLILPSMFYYGSIMDSIIKIIQKVVPDMEILFKYKTKRFKKLGKHAPKLKDVHIIPDDDMIYNYLFADMFLILGYGSAFLECLLANKRVIMYMEKNTPVTKRFNELPMAALGKLMIIYGRDRLSKCIENCKTDEYFDEQYEIDRNKLFSRELDLPKPEYVSKTIANDIIRISNEYNTKHRNVSKS
jgi:hypothetical protein